MKALAWQYYFYVEGQGSLTGERGDEMMRRLSEQCETLKVIGRFSAQIALREEEEA